MRECEGDGRWELGRRNVRAGRSWPSWFLDWTETPAADIESTRIADPTREDIDRVYSN